MTPEAQRIAIAEVCGWTKIGAWDGLCGPHGHKPGNPFGCLSKVPDYPADLNAVHEAEKVLNQSGTWQYAANLGRVVGQNLMKDIREHGEWMIAHATAAQRAEAFLRTIGKWEDK